MNKIGVLGVDLGKCVIHVYGVDSRGRQVLVKRFTRMKFREFLHRLPPCVVGMESGGGSHYWARLVLRLGHDARLIAPQYVTAFVQRNKNDWCDAQAICEAVQRPQMRFVTVKTLEQHELQMLHRMRSRVRDERTALVNQIRGFLLEFGVAVSCGRHVLLRRLPEVLEAADNELTDVTRELLWELYQELVALEARVGEFDARIEYHARDREPCRRLREVPGIGPLIATALLASAGDARQFDGARHFSASLGLVPRQHSTGGRPRLLGISKRGDKYLRTLLIHGARSVLRVASQRTDRLSRWALQVQKRRGTNVAVVALANKLARVAWVILARGERFAPRCA
jgi:transposase